MRYFYVHTSKLCLKKCARTLSLHAIRIQWDVLQVSSFTCNTHTHIYMVHQ
jgi:hypothetical protein